jgi:hypothetical protein
LNGNGSREEKKEERDLKIYILFEDKIIRKKECITVELIIISNIVEFW